MTAPTDQTLTLADLPKIVTLELFRETFGLSASGERRQRADGVGPTPIYLSPRKIVFTRESVQQWFSERARADHDAGADERHRHNLGERARVEA